MDILRLILIQQTLENKMTLGINSNNKPKENGFGIIFSFIIMSLLGISLYFFGSDSQSNQGNFFTDIRDKFQDWLEQSKCDALRKELLILVHHQEDLADRLMNHAKSQYPGNSERWYLEKVIYDLKRDR